MEKVNQRVLIDNMTTNGIVKKLIDFVFFSSHLIAGK